MSRQSGKKNFFAAGLGILAAAACLCLKGLKQVDQRLKKKS